MTVPDAVAGRLRVLSEAVLAATSVEDVVDAFLAAARALLAVDQVHLIEVAQDAAVDFPLGRYFSPVGPHEFTSHFRWGFSDLTPDQLREAVHRVAVAFASPLARR